MLEEIREEAKKVYSSLEFPSLRYGLGISLELDFDAKEVIRDKNNESSLLVKAPSEVKVLSVNEVGKDLFEKYFAKLIKVAKNKFSALHYSLLSDIKFVIIPKGVELDRPIYIESEANNILAEHIVVVAESNSKANVIINKRSSGHFASQFVEAYAENGASLDFFNVDNHSSNTVNIVYHEAEALQDSSVNWTDVILGSSFTQLWIETKLLEQGASTKKYTAFFSNREQQFDLNDVVKHFASNTDSVTYSRGAVDDKSKTVYRGNIRVEKKARNCSGHQKADNILLSDEAKCNAVPILEVSNDEISCSHGATFSKVNDEHLFYLTSRGLDKEMARQTLILGFFEKILKGIPDNQVREDLSKIIKEKLSAEVSHVAN